MVISARSRVWPGITGNGGERTWRGRARALVLLAAAAGLALSGAACTRARAETVPDGPPLATPAPPPRVLAPVEEILVEAAPLPDPPVEAPREASPAPPAARRPPVADAAKPAEPPATPATPPAAETAVRTPAPNPAEEKRISDIIARATRDIGNVDYGGLSENGKAQYNESKRFAELAASAVKERNYPQAVTLANKAADIADQLLRLQ